MTQINPNDNTVPEGKTLEQQAFEKTCGDYEKDKQALQLKYGVVDVPILRYTPHGIIPAIIYQDLKSFKTQQDALIGSIKNQ